MGDGVSASRATLPGLGGSDEPTLPPVNPDNLAQSAFEAYLAGRENGFADAMRDLPAAMQERVRAAMEGSPRDRAALSKSLKEERDRLERKLKPTQDALDSVRDLKAWLELTRKSGLRVQSVSDSLLHKVREDGILYLTNTSTDPDGLRTYTAPDHIIEVVNSVSATFLIQHDWAALLKTADVDDGEIRLPYERVCFEIAVSGRRLCIVVSCQDGIPYEVVPIWRGRGGWAVFGSCRIANGAVVEDAIVTSDPSFELAIAQIRAIAITLDAEVVTATAIRAPHKLNVQRVAKGRVPIYDHHVLSLSRRPRLEPTRGEPTGRKVRLHFRRGHWRHYATHKTWIKWMLVGDPTLGFADKDYRL